MKFIAVVPFTIKTSQGNYILPAGKHLELSQEQVAKLGDKVRSADVVSPKNVISAEQNVWPPKFKAWRTPDGGLRTIGVCDDLAVEIINLTANNLPLQAKLLRLHVGAYSGPQWRYLVEIWIERSTIMEFDGGISRKEAELASAKLYRLEAFLDELRNQITGNYSA